MLSSSQARQVESQRGTSPVRERVLRAARAIVAERGPEALTVSEVAHRADVNRGTAYQYFRTREHLQQAVKEWFVTELNRMLSEEGPIGARTDSLMDFLSEHRELARLWLYALLASDGDEDYEGWQRFLGVVHALAEDDSTQDGIDAEMLARILVAAAMIWSLWAPKLAHEHGDDVPALTRRFNLELKRLLLYGFLRPDSWPDLVQSLDDSESQDARAHQDDRQNPR